MPEPRMGPNPSRARHDWKGVKRGRGPILPGLRSLYAPQTISDRPVRLGSPHRAGRCATGRTRFSSPGCRGSRDMERCTNRGWGPILPGCGGTGGVKRKDGALSSPGFARSTRPRQSAIGPCDWGFNTVRRGVDAGELDFRPRVVEVVEIWKKVCTGDGAQSSPGAAGLGGSNKKTGPYPPRVVLALRAPANQRSARGIEVSTPCDAVSTRENSIFVPGSSEKQRYGGMPVPGMGPNVRRVRRDWKGVKQKDGALSSPGCARSTRPSQSAIGPWH